jgi:hypothetical protein
MSLIRARPPVSTLTKAHQTQNDDEGGGPMSKPSICSIFLAVPALTTASLGCVTILGETPPWVAADVELQDRNRNACDTTQYLQVTGEITTQGTNQFGTRSCEYRLRIKNSNKTDAVRLYVYQHEKDGFALTEKSHWMGNVRVDPGKEGEWTGSIYIKRLT